MDVSLDPRSTVRCAYNFLLGREPESEAAIEQHISDASGPSLKALRRKFLCSPEFASNLRSFGIHVRNNPRAVGPVTDFLPDDLTGISGFFTDRFGLKTRVDFLPSSYKSFSGLVGSADGEFDMPLHEGEEISALLRSVAEARENFAILELGAGWGPWISLGGHLARRRGLPVKLMGVEGSSEHVSYMETHLRDNGFLLSQYNALHAVVGTYDGIARFPKLTDPASTWGAEAVYNSGTTGTGEFVEVPCLSLQTLLNQMPILDLLHSDIQGAEADVFASAIGLVNQRVRRVCIGTHGRSAEGRLLDLFASEGWNLEFEEPCTIIQDGTKVANIADGVQVWSNSRLRLANSATAAG